MLKRFFSILIIVISLIIIFVIGFGYLPNEAQDEINYGLSQVGEFFTYLTTIQENGNPVYFSFLSSVLTITYLYIFVPIAILIASYVLLAYSTNMIRGRDGEIIQPEVKFRRGVATLFPFLISLYTVLADQFYKIPQINLTFYIMLITGLVVGFLFIYWISRMPESELFATLSCFVSSTIFFSILTVFVITRSFEIISFVFGFLFGICLYITRYGFNRLKMFRLPQLKFKTARK